MFALVGNLFHFQSFGLIECAIYCAKADVLYWFIASLAWCLTKIHLVRNREIVYFICKKFLKEDSVPRPLTKRSKFLRLKI